MLSPDPGVAAVEAGRPGRVRGFSVCGAGRGISGASFPGHAAGALGGSCRLLPLNSGRGDFRFDLRRRYRAAPTDRRSWLNSSKSMRTGSSLTWKIGPSPTTEPCCRACRGITCAFVRPGVENLMPATDAAKRLSASTTAVRESEPTSKRGMWSMQVFWNWSGTESGARMIR